MNKLLVITGGTKGIGRAIIHNFAEKGFDIATCARNANDLKVLKETVERSHPNIRLHYQPTDMAVKAEVFAFGAFVASLNQAVEILVNNAGLFIPGTVHDEDDGALEKMINTNLYSAYHLSRAIVPDMKARKGGHVFNMCSTASITAYANGGSYCISKFALLGMSKVLREEMKEHNVKVTSIIPGATLTASWEGVDLPPERFMKPEDVADAVATAYFASPNSVFEEIVIRPQLGDL